MSRRATRTGISPSADDGPGENRPGEDIEIIDGRNRILLVAPHGHKKDDENTGMLTREIAGKLGCYALISEIYRKPARRKDPKTGEIREFPDPENKRINLNRRDQVETYIRDEFLMPLVVYTEEIIQVHGSALLLWMHGIKDENINKESTDGDPSRVHVLIGIGQGDPDYFTAAPQTVDRLIASFEANGRAEVIASRAKRGSAYCGQHPNIMNQYFNKEGYPLYKVQSIQLEIKYTGYRDIKSIPKAVETFCAAFSKLVSEF